MPYYLPRTGERTDGFMPEQKAFALCEMQAASTSIWTRVAGSIFNYVNQYTAHKLFGVFDFFKWSILKKIKYSK